MHARRLMSTGAVAEPEKDDGYEAIFNVNVFSDRELRVEVVGHDDHAPGSGASRKRHREEDKGDDLEDIDSSCTVSSTPVLRVETIYVSSAILAAKSSFFYKVFSNGMKESAQGQATVRTADSEEKAFMELLRYMHSGKLTATTEPSPLVDLLIAADKLEVVYFQ